MDFQMAELELILAKGLDMYKFYKILEGKVAAKGYFKTCSEAAKLGRKESISVTKITGIELEEIFTDGYDRMCTESFDEDKDFPQIY